MAKMAKYHHFQKFAEKKHCFGTMQGNTTFLELKFHKLKFQMVLEFMKLEFLIGFATVALLRWKLVRLFYF